MRVRRRRERLTSAMRLTSAACLRAAPIAIRPREIASWRARRGGDQPGASERRAQDGAQQAPQQRNGRHGRRSPHRGRSARSRSDHGPAKSAPTTAKWAYISRPVSHPRHAERQRADNEKDDDADRCETGLLSAGNSIGGDTRLAASAASRASAFLTQPSASERAATRQVAEVRQAPRANRRGVGADPRDCRHRIAAGRTAAVDRRDVNEIAGVISEPPL